MLSDGNLQKLSELMDKTAGEGRRNEGTVEVVSVFAYLIGVGKGIFLNEHEPPQLEYYNQLEADKRARIIRNLCMCRTAIERNFKKINLAIKYEYKSISSMPDYVPQESVRRLAEDGIDLVKKSNTQAVDYVIEINRHITDRINNCKDLFPTWLNWNYIKDLFIMPDGLTVPGTKAAAETYYANRDYYPYQVYMNWVPQNEGNVLYNDRKFVRLLYAWNNDSFEQLDKVQDVTEAVTGSIYDFIERGTKVTFLVDCENSDPYHLFSALDSLEEEYKSKIARIILFDDVHTTPAWAILEQHTAIPVEHNLIDRLKDNKSLVDITLTARLCQEFYQNGADSFVIASSDSDYWGVIQSLPTANFLVMVEHGKCGPDMRAALKEKGIYYCYIDEFYSGRSDKIKTNVLYREMAKYMEENLNFNLMQMLDAAAWRCRITMDDVERQRFFEKYLRPAVAVIDEEGKLRLELKRPA